MKKGSIMLAFLFLLVAVSVIANFSHAQAVKPIELKYAAFISTTHEIYIYIMEPFKKMVEKQTNGRVIVTLYPGEALGKAKDQLDMAARGICDIAGHMPTYTPGRFPLTGVMELPLGIPSAKVGSHVFFEVYEKHLKQEYSGIKIPQVWTVDPYQFLMGKKPVKSLEDLKGLRLRSPGPLATKLIRELGASPVNLPMPDTYDAVRRGLVDGVVGTLSVLRSYKLAEVVRYATVADLFVVPAVTVMNQRTWDSLPKDLQKTIHEIAVSQIDTAGGLYDEYAQFGKEDLTKKGGEIFRFPPEEMKKLQSRFEPFNEEWISKMEKKGLPARKIYEDARLLVKSYSK